MQFLAGKSQFACRDGHVGAKARPLGSGPQSSVWLSARLRGDGFGTAETDEGLGAVGGMAVAIFEPQAKSWAFSIAKISWKRGMSAESMPIWKVPPWMRTIESSVFVDGVSVEGVDAAGVVCAWAQQVEEKQNSKVRYAVAILICRYSKR
jgi:hypothetical protein